MNQKANQHNVKYFELENSDLKPNSGLNDEMNQNILMFLRIRNHKEIISRQLFNEVVRIFLQIRMNKILIQIVNSAKGALMELSKKIINTSIIQISNKNCQYTYLKNDKLPQPIQNQAQNYQFSDYHSSLQKYVYGLWMIEKADYSSTKDIGKNIYENLKKNIEEKQIRIWLQLFYDEEIQLDWKKFESQVNSLIQQINYHIYEKEKVQILQDSPAQLFKIIVKYNQILGIYHRNWKKKNQQFSYQNWVILVAAQKIQKFLPKCFDIRNNLITITSIKQELSQDELKQLCKFIGLLIENKQFLPKFLSQLDEKAKIEILEKLQANLTEAENKKNIPSMNKNSKKIQKNRIVKE